MGAKGGGFSAGGARAGGDRLGPDIMVRVRRSRLHCKGGFQLLALRASLADSAAAPVPSALADALGTRRDSHAHRVNTGIAAEPPAAVRAN